MRIAVLVPFLLITVIVSIAPQRGFVKITARGLPGRSSTKTAESTYPFEFHSGFWINLHHFLYEQATLRKEVAASNAGTAATVIEIKQLSAEQQRQWNKALDYYTQAIINRDLIADRELVVTNDLLSIADDYADLSKSEINADLRRVLESVAPIYRTKWWPKHDKANRFWIAVVTPMVQQFSQTLITQLIAAFKGRWPDSAIRVDVVEYANWAGAYTTFTRDRKVHTTIVSIEKDYQGFAALEMLFHEASHSMVDPRNGAVAAAIARECKAKNKPIPNGLWHAIIFYTSGEFTKRNLRDVGVTDYTPAGYKGMYTRVWPNFQRPLELYWQPYLDGSLDFDKAISSMIAAL